MKILRSDRIEFSGKNGDYHSIRKITHDDVRVIMILYTRWRGMNKRCLRPRYIEKNVYVDKKWSGLRGFENFVIWSLGNGFSPKLVIDRENNNGPYAPDNCRWVTSSRNLRNTMNSVFVLYKNENIHLKDLAEHVDCVVPYHILRGRIRSMGWSVDNAVTVPISHANGHLRLGNAKR